MFKIEKHRRRSQYFFLIKSRLKVPHVKCERYMVYGRVVHSFAAAGNICFTFLFLEMTQPPEPNKLIPGEKTTFWCDPYQCPTHQCVHLIFSVFQIAPNCSRSAHRAKINCPLENGVWWLVAWSTAKQTKFKINHHRVGWTITFICTGKCSTVTASYSDLTKGNE